MLLEPVPAFVPCAYRVKLAVHAWERAGAARLRKKVFCDEQRVFEGHDCDAIDAHATVIVALSTLAWDVDEVVGTVRIHEPSPGIWWGSRLAVERAYRRVGALGASLIRVAVSSAHAHGCEKFFAHVQSQNAALFHALHWATLDEVELHGRAHHLMEADLAHYPAMADPEAGLVTMLRRAA